MIPVHVLTGFLGSGKTTLLRQLLRDPEMGRAAVIVNEFGEIGIDHDLLATSDENVVQLSNGCLCCRVRSDLVLTLDELAARRRSGDANGFERVIVETSGLADPVPIVNALMSDAQVRREYRLGEIVTAVDGVLGCATLAQYAESARQVAVADRVVITKVDRPDARADAVKAAVRRMRPSVPTLPSMPGRLRPSDLFAGDNAADADPNRTLSAWVPIGPRMEWSNEPDHSSGIESVAIERGRPLHAATLPLFLSAIAENFGPHMLRLKGIVGIAEDPDRPAVVHGVQHLYEAPQWLPAWPSPDRSTRIVCIGSRLHAEWIRSLLNLLDEEVADEAARGPDPAGG